jgi:hypothetical protein
MRAPDDLTGAGIYKAMAARPRLPKPWEPDFEEAKAFMAWADAIPESTSRALLPMIWPLRDRLQFQDGGGLNGFLKERGLTKPAWKVIAGLSLAESAAAYNYYRGKGDMTWAVRLVKPAVSVKELEVEASLPLLFTMAEADISTLSVPRPYQQDWRLMLKALSDAVKDKSLSECAQISGDVIIVRDYFESGDVDVSSTTTWAEMKALADQWVINARAEEMEYENGGAAVELANEIAASPGGADLFTDAVTGMTVHRLTAFDQFVAESDAMGHCIGRSQNYFNKHLNGTGAFYSFRLPNQARPVATLELGLTEGTWRICQVRGPSNRDPGEASQALSERMRDAHQVGGEIRETTYELTGFAGGRPMPGLDQTHSRYF